MDESHTELRVSLDIDPNILERRLREASLDFGGLAPIPLVLLKKELQLDLDVRDSNGRPLSVETSAVDSHFAHAYLLKEFIDSGLSPDLLTDDVTSRMYRIVSSHDGLHLLTETIETVTSQAKVPIRERQPSQMSDAEVNAWVVIMRETAFKRVLEDLSDSYFMITALHLSAEASVVKYRRHAYAASKVRRVGLMTLGLKPLAINLKANGVGVGLREHSRVIAPPGSRIIGGSLLRGTVPVPRKDYQLRVDDGRIVYYTENSPESNSLSSPGEIGRAHV